MKRSRRYLSLSQHLSGAHELGDAVSILTALHLQGPVTLTQRSAPRDITVHDLPHGRGRATHVGLLSPEPTPRGVIDASALSTEDIVELDVLVAHPSLLTSLDAAALSRARMLPGTATLTLGLDAAVLAERYRDGRVAVRADRDGNASVPVGSLSMSSTELLENCLAVGSGTTLVGHGLPPLRLT